ncbi:helix-turn-helix domain-containing protein [Nonomuraea soli]|uniref:Transcriptional regulator with XRE-family HTH domain n=1 Tax=Nonomuraea soli TaxID=1032476 RepID=A0A7W0HMX6_9ACTN|nr:helix-turn-helix transcriptional regulator [Nonomuraea soli]MBA2889240.1 transcriptional regulator with XRE-family HTH domain [Nonomuraea soli]
MDDDDLPLLPGFREMAMARRDMIERLAEERRSSGLSQTEVAARMGTSQSAVARLESGEADVRASTLERYAAAIGHRISWRLSLDAVTGTPSEPTETDHGSGLVREPRPLLDPRTPPSTGGGLGSRRLRRPGRS